MVRAYTIHRKFKESVDHRGPDENTYAGEPLSGAQERGEEYGI